jgi:signal transduction histidine kinase
VSAVTVSFALTMVSFAVSRTITEIVSRRIQREAESIGKNALIATEALVAARTNLRKSLFDMSALRASAHPVAVAEVSSELDASRQDLAACWAKYVAIPFYPGEREQKEEVERDIKSEELAVGKVSERLHQGDREGAIRFIDERALYAIERADEGLARLVHLNAGEAQDAAERILASRRPWGLLPELLGVFFAIAAAYFGVRLLVQYLAWAAERSEELELFAGRVAHDIRSPLGSASLALEVAQRGRDIDSKTRELLARVGRTMQRIAKLVDGLLVFATSGGYIVPGTLGEPKANPNEVLGGIVEDLRLEAEAKNIEIEYEAPDPNLVVACSPGVLISMTTNLVANSMKFMGDAALRRITIRVCQVGDDVEIAVSDTGPGIPPEVREKVFEPYVRGESKLPGFGLGLATVRKLAEAHGGTVGVDKRPESGCHIWFRLPTWKSVPEKRSWHALRPAPTAQT